MSTVKPLYGTAGVAMTVTLASLANNAARQTTAVDNTSNLYGDARVQVKAKLASSGVSVTGVINVYFFASVDGTTFDEGLGATDAAVTFLSTPSNLPRIYTAYANAASQVLNFEIPTLAPWCPVTGLPAKWGLVLENLSGAALDATSGNFAVTYTGSNQQIV